MGDGAVGFLEFIADSPLVIHNAEFDLKFLNAELGKIKKTTLSASRAVDTMLMARRKFPGSPASLDALCRKFNINLEERKAKGHGAMLDVELLAQVYLELSGGRQPGLEFSDKLSANSNIASARTSLPARPQPLASRLSEEELANHEALVRGLGPIAIWRS